MTIEEIIAFHRQVAEELRRLYTGRSQAPQDWYEIVAWHYEQAAAYAQAVEATLEIAEVRMTRLDFASARRWTERTLTLLERLGTAEREIYDLRTYALALAVLEFGGQYREGLDYARRMLGVAQARGNREAAVRAYLAVGRMQRELGQLTSAEAVLQQARTLAAEDELSELEAEIRLHLAKVHQLQGRHLEALQELQLAQEENEQRDDRAQLAQVFGSIGDIYRLLGSARESTAFYTRALSIEQGRGNLLGQAILRDKLALALLEQNKLAEALAEEEESLRLRQSVNDVVGQARSYSVLGTILARFGHYDEAREHQERALALEEQLQNPRGQGIALLHLGDTASALHQYEQAHAFYARALVVTRRENDQIGLARALERMGDLCYAEGSRERANANWVEALKIRESMHHSEEANLLRERIRGGHLPK